MTRRPDLHFASVWEAVTDAVPDVDAIVMGRTRISYRDYEARAARFAGALHANGVQPGANIALYLYNCPEYLISQFGAFKNGCGAINVNYRYLDDELSYLLDNSDAEVLVYHRSLADRVGRVCNGLDRVRLLVEVDDEDGERPGTAIEGAIDFDELLATHEPLSRRPQNSSDTYMLYTGGTTGMPKGVMYDQGAFVERIYERLAASFAMSPPGSSAEVSAVVRAAHQAGPIVAVPCCPLMHGTGMWVGTMPAHCSGGTVVLLESRSFDADELLAVIERERVTRPVIVGDAFARPIVRALEAARGAGAVPDLSSVTSVVSSGAMWSREIKDAMSQHMTNAVLVDALGSTEGGAYGQVESDPDTSAPTARFRLSPSTRVVDELGEVLAMGSGSTGLLASQTAARGYYKDPEKSARTFTEIDGDWYVITGDWATCEPDGTITLHGRGSNCINSGGEKVYPEEVEEAMKTHPAIEDCYVVGVDDERFGQRVVAVASAGEGAPTETELRDHLRALLSGYKIPKQIVVLPELHRAPNGKADYGWARETIRKSLI